MISIETGSRLKAAGLAWKPAKNDFFAIPERGLDREIFVLSHLLSFVEFRHGRQVVSFHGAVEWALDYLVLSEAIWLPTESQLREILVDLVHRSMPTSDLNGGSALTGQITLELPPQGPVRLSIETSGRDLIFEAEQAEEAYAAAVLALLERTGV